MRQATKVVPLREKRRIKIEVSTLDGNRPRVTPKDRRENNIKPHHKKMGSDGVERIRLNRNRVQWHALVNKVVILGVLKNAGDFLNR
jgi:hypothetical protein